MATPPKLYKKEDSPSSGTGASSSTDLASHYVCPVCNDYAFPPIYQCEAGHLICSTCKPKVRGICPTCRGRLGNTRNLVMEKMAETSVFFPCKFSAYGCKAVKLLYRDKAKHEVGCNFRRYICPYLGKSCKFSGLLDKVAVHLTNDHRESISSAISAMDSGLKVNHRDTTTDLWAKVQFYGKPFLILVKREKGQWNQQLFVVTVTLIGTLADAEKYLYKLTMTGNLGQKQMWECKPRSIQGDYTGKCNNTADCFVFYKNKAEDFSKDGDLEINVSISMK